MRVIQFCGNGYSMPELYRCELVELKTDAHLKLPKSIATMTDLTMQHDISHSSSNNKMFFGLQEKLCILQFKIYGKHKLLNKKTELL